jgi:hypothetical protein
MTMAGEPLPIHPVFLRIFEKRAMGLAFEPQARHQVMKVLARGTDAFPDGARHQQDSEFEDAMTRLDAAMNAIAGELMSRGITHVDEASLTLLMQAQCPLPPFCYGPESLSEPGAAAGPETAAEEPALANV